MYLGRKAKISKDINYYLESNYKIHPYFEAVKVTLAYGIVGTAWILLSDECLSKFIQNIDSYKRWATYKGWAYVGITMILIYFFVLRRLILFKKALEKISDSFNELSTRNKELEMNRNALAASEEKYKSLVYYDALTGLPNRSLFELKMTELINEKDKDHKEFALMYMDIDNFKKINDTLGHDSGDLLLKYVSKILENQIRESDLAARLSGDEFAIIFDNIMSRQDIVNKIQKLLKALKEPWLFEEQKFFISFSIGISIYPEDGNDLALLIKHADLAMYAVKKNMKDNFSFFIPEMEDENLKHIKMVNELRQAIENEEFLLCYQPIMNLKTEELVAIEALVRWVHPTKGIISPKTFIPLAEETGLIDDIEKYVLKTALMEKKHWQQQGYPHIKMSINISGKTMTHDTFVDELRRLTAHLELKYEEIQLEVTETAVMENINVSASILKEIKKMGIKVALDDFGSGYSSLTYLQNLPIDVVKLDRGFIKDISTSRGGKIMADAIIKLAHDLNLEIVAEGIEQSEQLDFLKLNGCDYGQGYLFNRPMTREEIEKLLLIKGKTL
ncbi:MAG: domain S-box/diguanylate cyclase protein [Clostridia bacterium]|jgi:diguanylate cyclase (GGDEF)-like protein|nr:domain S-box/diguanylate cyclase protein [Clostridia bacterium]